MAGANPGAPNAGPEDPSEKVDGGAERPFCLVQGTERRPLPKKQGLHPNAFRAKSGQRS